MPKKFTYEDINDSSVELKQTEAGKELPQTKDHFTDKDANKILEFLNNKPDSVLIEESQWRWNPAVSDSQFGIRDVVAPPEFVNIVFADLSAVTGIVRDVNPLIITGIYYTSPSPTEPFKNIQFGAVNLKDSTDANHYIKTFDADSNFTDDTSWKTTKANVDDIYNRAYLDLEFKKYQKLLTNSQIGNINRNHDDFALKNEVYSQAILNSKLAQKSDTGLTNTNVGSGNAGKLIEIETDGSLGFVDKTRTIAASFISTPPPDWSSKQDLLSDDQLAVVNAKPFTTAEKTKLASAITSHQDISGKQDLLSDDQLAVVNAKPFTTAEKTKLASAITSHQDISGKQDLLSDDQLAVVNAKPFTTTEKTQLTTNTTEINTLKTSKQNKLTTIQIDNINKDHSNFLTLSVSKTLPNQFLKSDPTDGDTIGYGGLEQRDLETISLQSSTSGKILQSNGTLGISFVDKPIDDISWKNNKQDKLTKTITLHFDDGSSENIKVG